MEKLQQKCHRKPGKRGLRSLLSGYFNSELRMARKLYVKAKEDESSVGQFLAEFSKLQKEDRDRLYGLIDDDFEHCTRMLRNCDIIEPEAKNVIRIFMESSGGEEKERIRKGVHEIMKEVVFSGNGRAMASRKFALEIIMENDLKDKETYEGVFRLKNDTELKNHALDCVLESKKLSVEEKETLVRGFTGDLDYAVERILDGKPHEKEGELVFSLVLEKMRNPDGGVFEDANATLGLLLCDESAVKRELVAMAIEKQIKEGDNAARNAAVATVMLARTMIADSDFETNIDGGNVLHSLRFLPEARKIIRDDAVPDFNDMANDGSLSMEKRKAATAMLKKLTSV